MNEQTKKALALIAAELHLQNFIALNTSNSKIMMDSTISSQRIAGLANHFAAYFDGGKLDVESALFGKPSS